MINRRKYRCSSLILIITLFILFPMNLQEIKASTIIGATYYVSPNGLEGNLGTLDKPLSFQAAVYKAQPGDTIILRGGSYSGKNTGRIDIDNKKGSPTAWYTITNYPDETVTMDGQNKPDIYGAQALNFDKSSFWRVKGLSITNYTGGGIYLTNGTNHVIMSDLTISDLDSPTDDGIGVAGIMADKNTSYCTVTNSNIYDIGLKLNKPKDHGIYIGYGADYWTFEYNRIHDTAGAGIQMYGQPNGGSYSTIRSNLIYNNHAYGLAIASNATGNSIADNIFYGNNTCDVFFFDNVQGNTFRNNLFASCNASCNIAISDLASVANNFDFNEYRKSSGPIVSCYDSQLDFSDWCDYSQEEHGQFSTQPFPESQATIDSTSNGYTFKRLGGPTHFATASVIGEELCQGGSTDNIIVASGLNFPDALSGSVLAKKLNAPILLAGLDSSDCPETLEFIKSHLSSQGTVYILGGTGAVSTTFEESLRSLGVSNIKRIAGLDRFDTNKLINDEINPTKGTPVVIASGNDFPDALSISSIAAAKGYPIILTDKEELSIQGRETLKQLQPSSIYFVGGTGVISNNVKNQTKELIGLPDSMLIRLWGWDRYETSIQIADYFKVPGTTVTFASGENFPDALSGCILAAKMNAPIILIDKDATKQKSFLNFSGYSRIVIFGGKREVDNSIVEQLCR